MPRQRDTRVRRLFQSDGVTFVRWIDETDIKQMAATKQIKPYFEKRTGRNLGFKLVRISGESSLLPFSRPTRADDRFRYEVPHAGDCRSVSLRRFGLRRAIIDQKHVLLSRTRKVSGRKLDFTAAAYSTRARVLSVPNNVPSALNSPAHA